MKDPVSFAVAQCPFLAKVAAQNGDDYARSIAINPTEVAAAPQGPDSLKQYEASFQLFHGPNGIVPLVHSTSNTKPVAGGVCPFHAQRAAAAASEAAPSSVTSSKPLPRTLPLATISLSFGTGSNFGDFLRKQLHKKSHSQKRPPQQHRQPPSSNSSHPTNSGSSGPGHKPTNTNPHGPSAGNPSSGSFNKPQRPLTDPTGSISSSSSSSARSSGLSSSSSTSKGLRGLGSGPSGMGPGINPNPSSLGMQSSAAAASGTTAATPSTAASPKTFNPSSSTGGAGGSSSTTAAGLRGFSSSSGGINGPGAGSSPYKSSAGGSSSGGGGGLMGSNNTRSGLSGTGSSSRGPARGTGGPARGPKPPGSTSSKIASSSSSSSAAPPSKCPARKWLGPFAGLVFNEYDKIVCPQPIVAARAALAKTAAVQQLRPQQLPVKLVAVAAVAAAANLPAGAVREHFEKFSLGWFIAVHATIPFVAMLRKAVIMPKYSILVTIASAVIGQLVGSRLERARLQYQQAAVATQIAGSPIAASNSSSSSGAQSMSKVVRDSSWRQKLLAGGAAGFETADQDLNPTAAAVGAAAAAAAACGAGMGGHGVGVVGLGSLFAKLPVVKV